MADTIKCLYCDSDNKDGDEACSRCGMPLPDCHVHGVTYRRGRFKWWFWAIAVFCVVMIFYLPR